MNDDLISRDAVLESIKNLYPDMPVMDIMGARRKWLEKYAPYFECENAVEHLPSVTPKQRTGHWQDLTGLFFCSECDGGFAKPWRYCPNCGAKMEEQE